MNHFTANQKHVLFAPGYTGDELQREVNTRIGQRKIHQVGDYDGSNWDTWQHAWFLTFDSW